MDEKALFRSSYFHDIALEQYDAMPSKRSSAKETGVLLSAVNALDEAAFATHLPEDRSLSTKDGNKNFPWTFHTSSNLSSDDLELCFRLIEETSSADYKAASQGWHPKAKREEMLDNDMRYIILREKPDDGAILAFTSFMLTPEDDEPVIYIYEIHLSPALRGSGIGKQLVSLVESIGKSVRVSMSMLTVFTANKHAEAFYRHLGYTQDESSPRERKLRGGKIKRPEYLIMSKSLKQVDPPKRRKLSTSI